MPSTTQDLHHLAVLCAFAHPDDEGFATGGTLAMLVHRGARLTMVCATNGEVGEISDPALATPETLGQVRQEELRQAMAITGIPDLRFLHYRDSGMAGTADNQHPKALLQAASDRVISQLVSIIREVRPNILITHDSTGGYGHPDHQAMCRHATAAFTLAGDPTAYPESLVPGQQPWTPGCLYHVGFPRSTFRRMWKEMRAMGISPPFASQEFEALGTPDDEVTTIVDVTPYVETKIASLACHRTQITADGPFSQLPREMLHDIMRTEYFTLISPLDTERDMDVLATL